MMGMHLELIGSSLATASFRKSSIGSGATAAFLQKASALAKITLGIACSAEMGARAKECDAISSRVLPSFS